MTTTRTYTEPFRSFGGWAFNATTRGRSARGNPWKSTFTHGGFATQDAAQRRIDDLKAADAAKTLEA